MTGLSNDGRSSSRITMMAVSETAGGPLVSVIIPAYNRARYIDQTICSVLDQGWKNIQLILVDDGSNDGTLEKIMAYGDRLLLLTHPDNENRGQSASINLGLRRATGKYIAILDSDDFWHPAKLEVQVAYLEQHPDIGLVYTNGYVVDADGKILYPFYAESHEEKNDTDRVLLDCYILLPQNSLVRKSVYERVGEFEESYRSAQDHDMLIRIAEVTRFAYLPDFLWYYRQHQNSISGTSQELRWRTGFRILESATQRYSYKAATIRKRKAVLNYRMGIVCRNENRMAEAILYLGKALLLDPVRALMVLTGYDKSR